MKVLQCQQRPGSCWEVTWVIPGMHALSLLCAGSPGAISLQGFIPCPKALHGKRGLDVSICPLFPCLAVTIPL